LSTPLTRLAVTPSSFTLSGSVKERLKLVMVRSRRTTCGERGSSGSSSDGQ
jgi:hypothetical protein